MRKVIVAEWMSLDGVVQSPAYADEDPSGGFEQGGWHARYTDERSLAWVGENISQAGGLLLGRRTYDVFAAHWPNASPEEQRLARPLNALPKYVASRTLKEPLGWQHATLLGSPVEDSVAQLRREDGGDLLVIGSSQLVAELLALDLVDELRLTIDPVILGGGKRFFREDRRCLHLELVTSETLSTGAILVTYSRSGAGLGPRAAPLPRPPADRRV